MDTSAHDDDVAGVVTLDRPTERLDHRGAAAAEGDEDDLVTFKVDDVIQARTQSYQVGRCQSTDEHGKLPPLAEILAGAGDLAEALRVGDVVGDEVGVDRRRPPGGQRTVKPT
jgi:hypothetical protein